MRRFLIHLLGGWPKDEALTEAVKELFNTISSDDILKDDNGVWSVNGKTITEGEKKLLISEASLFSKSRLWKILKNEIKYLANKAMFEKAKTENDIIAGKLWLYTLDAIDTKLNKMTT